MIPGEILTDGPEHPINPGRRSITLVVRNTADRPIQVGSHYHFAETNGALGFDRAAAHGMRLEHSRPARRCALSPASSARWSWWTMPADRQVYGFRGLVQGKL